MSYQARWGPKGFIISNKKIVSIEGLTTSYELDADTNDDTSGTPPTNTKGQKLQPVSFSTKYLKATGTDPKTQLAEWKSLIGKSYPFILGGKKFGPAKLQLQKVDVSDILLSNKGVMLACTVSLSFMEYSPTSTTNAATTAKTSDASNKAAMSAKPSTAEKASKKNGTYATGTSKERWA